MKTGKRKITITGIPLHLHPPQDLSQYLMGVTPQPDSLICQKRQKEKKENKMVYKNGRNPNLQIDFIFSIIMGNFIKIGKIITIVRKNVLAKLVFEDINEMKIHRAARA